MELNSFDHKYVRILDIWGNTFEGLTVTFPAGYGLHVFDRDEDSIRIENHFIFATDINEDNYGFWKTFIEESFEEARIWVPSELISIHKN